MGGEAYLRAEAVGRGSEMSAADDCVRYREALEEIGRQQQETLAMIASNGFVFTSIGKEPGNWQHLAFSIYNDLCRIDTLAHQALDDGVFDI